MNCHAPAHRVQFQVASGVAHETSCELFGSGNAARQRRAGNLLTEVNLQSANGQELHKSNKQTPDRHQLIIDCDPGVDDAIAILLALASPAEIEVLGITTVAGNVPLERTTSNALTICDLAGVEIPVHAGCSVALSPGLPRQASSHGLDGLGDIGLGPSSRHPQARHAVDFIIETIKCAPGQISLCAIGPMTNIASALARAPEIAPQIGRLVFMGGAAFCPGNTTPAAEFNMWIDPTAAKMVLGAGIPAVMCGLDVTLQAVLTEERIATLRRGSRPVARAVAALMASYGEQDSCLHDSCAIAYLIDPSLFDGLWAEVVVADGSSPDRGLTLVKPEHCLPRTRNATCKVMTTVDDARLFQLLTDRLLSI